MKKYSNLIVVLISFLILLFILINKSIVANTIITSFSIWFNTLVPSMFPMFILSDILIKYNFVNYIPSKIINTISKIFNISKNGVLVLLLSIISGFPTNALNIINAFNNKLITKEESEHLLLFTHFSNPLFILQTVGVFYLNNNTYGLIILTSHILANIVIGILFRNKNTINNKYITNQNNCQSFGLILSNSIKKSMDTLIMIAGTITLFLILSTLICTIFNLNPYLSTLTKGILEITMGINSIVNLNINDIYKVVIITSFISFGGLSIHLQIYSCLDNKIRYKNFIKGRLYQTIISSFLSYLLMIILKSF